MLSKEKLFPCWFKRTLSCHNGDVADRKREIGPNLLKVKETGSNPKMVRVCACMTASQVVSSVETCTWGWTLMVLLQVCLEFGTGDQKPHRIDRIIVQPYFVMQVWTCGTASAASFAKHVAPRDLIAFPDQNL